MLLSDIRKRKHYTQQYVADQIGVSQATVAMWETGNSVPSMKNLLKLSELLNTDLSEICSSLKKVKDNN